MASKYQKLSVEKSKRCSFACNFLRRNFCIWVPRPQHYAEINLAEVASNTRNIEYAVGLLVKMELRSFQALIDFMRMYVASFMPGMRALMTVSTPLCFDDSTLSHKNEVSLQAVFLFQRMRNMALYLRLTYPLSASEIRMLRAR